MNTASALGNEGQARWSLRLLGGFELSTIPGSERVPGLGKRERVLLAYLALSPRGREQRRKLTTLLWGDAADETTLENLRNCLYSLRKTLGDGEHRVLASEGEDIVLDPTALDSDALVFRRLAAQSGRHDLEEAAKLYSGELLDGLDIESEEFESWRRTESARFRDQAVDVLHRLMMQLSETGESDRAIETGARLLRLDPMHEGTVRRLMRLYAQTGRRSTAIQLYRALSEALKADLDAQPEAETRAVFEEISRGEQPLAPAAAVATPAPSATVARPSDLPAAAPERPTPVIGMPRQVKANRRNWILAGGLAAAMTVVLLVYLLVPWTGIGMTQQEQTGAIAVAVAVLPFANLSSDPEQKFFSDGITEEITSALARVPDLGVVARTSAFQFEDQNRNIQEIARALHATHLIEGSVRKAGDQIRITAQLVLAENGLQLWSETYDRQLTDIFAIQEDIAQAIAGALRIPLGLQPGRALAGSRNIDPDDYEQFLRAKAQLLRGIQGSADVIPILEPLVARNPDYAPAWSKLALAYYFAYNGAINAPSNLSAEDFRRQNEVYRPKMEAALRRAVELDPNSVVGQLTQGALQFVLGKFALAEDAYSKALRLDPNHPDVLHYYSDLLLMVGRVKEGAATSQRLHELEPFIPNYAGKLANALWLDGQDEAAIAIYKDNLGRQGAGSAQGLAMIYASMGRYEEAAGFLSQLNRNLFPDDSIRIAADLMRSVPQKSAPSERLPPLGRLGFIYLHIGAPERVLDFYEQAVRTPAAMSRLWHPSYAPVRKMQAFKAFARNAGLVEYWRAKGWPEFCRPIGVDDFVCE